jgi:hypothetical protein
MASTCARRTRGSIRPVRSRAPSSPMAIRIMPAAVTARCSPRLRRLPLWRSAADRRTASRYLMMRQSASATSMCVVPAGRISTRPRSCWSMPASVSCRAITKEAGPGLPASSRCLRRLHHRGDLGLRAFSRPETGSQIDRFYTAHSDPSRCVLVGAYALGKHKDHHEPRARGHHDPISFHGAIERLTISTRRRC